MPATFEVQEWDMGLKRWCLLSIHLDKASAIAFMRKLKRDKRRPRVVSKEDGKQVHVLYPIYRSTRHTF